MKKSKIYKTTCFIMWVALMIVIYWFSSKPDYESSKQSIVIGKILCEIFVQGYEKMEETLQGQYAELLEHFARKLAHFTEYSVLGFLTINNFYLWKEKLLHLVRDEQRASLVRIVALGWCVLYAISDEVHQLFVPGRWGTVWDVLLDTLGAATGIILWEVLVKVINRRLNV